MSVLAIQTRVRNQIAEFIDSNTSKPWKSDEIVDKIQVSNIWRIIVNVEIDRQKVHTVNKKISNF